jgi:hypothetical protein
MEQPQTPQPRQLLGSKPLAAWNSPDHLMQSNSIQFKRNRRFLAVAKKA